MTRAHIAYIGVGSNLGDPKRNCQQAIDLLNSDVCQVLACSPFYRTEPVGYISQPPFINAVIKLNTDLSPIKLLGELNTIERKLGKAIKTRWGPRTIDLDILLYDNLIIKEQGLKIPHPRMQMRSFVMIPLVELEPELIHPVLGQSMRELLEQIKQPTMCVKENSA
jgi:2-amino-4-hydroxy-6-hydroxymethyldihydropteridine diphosphokinase